MLSNLDWEEGVGSLGDIYKGHLVLSQIHINGTYTPSVVWKGCLQRGRHSAILISDFCPLVTGLSISCK